MLRDQASHNGINMVFEHPDKKYISLMTDSARMKVLLANLIGNIIYFSKKNSTIKIIFSYFNSSTP